MKTKSNYKTALLIVTMLSLNSTVPAQVTNYFAGSGTGTDNTRSYCTGAGTNALHFSNSGLNNAAFGTTAFYYYTSGNNNTAVGRSGLQGSLTRFYNVAIGTSALKISPGAACRKRSIETTH